MLLDEIRQAGAQVFDSAEGIRFQVDQTNWDNNFQFLPPIEVNKDDRYLSGIAGFSPSPDWFTPFYLFDTINKYGQTFWQSFKIRTCPGMLVQMMEILMMLIFAIPILPVSYID